MRAVFAPDVKSGFSYLSKLVTASAGKKRRSWVLVPDGMVLTAERELSQSTPPSSGLYCDTVSFRRLANNIFRRFGGLHYNYADASAEALLMWRAISLCRDSLIVYGDSVSDPSAVPTVQRAITELKQSMITPEAFMKAAIKLKSSDEGESVADKCIDIANIYAAYEELLTESYDDRLKDISFAAQKLAENDYFEGGELYLFAFSSFTAQQYELLRRAARQASEIYVIFTCPCEYDRKAIEFDGIRDTVARLRTIAELSKTAFETETLPSVRDDVPYQLASGLWGRLSPISEEAPLGVELVECESERREAEYAAAAVARAVRGGLRYRDIAIITGSVDAYDGILDRALDEYGIPYHMSRRVKLETMPQIAALLSALRIVTGGWRREDIITFAYAGFAGITDDDADELEVYMSTWNISGKRFRDPDGGGWGMNPDGYTADWTETGETLLTSVNRSRKTICDLLSPLTDAFNDLTSADEKTTAVLDFMAASGISQPKTDGTDAESQVETLLSRALSAVSVTAEKGKMKASDYMCCLSLVLDTLSASTIPGRIDEVDVSDPLRMRGAGFRYVILLGCNDGVFPKDVKDADFFSDTEKTLLETAGVSVGAGGEKASMELYNFSRCVSSTWERLTVIYKTQKGATLPDTVGRMKSLYPALSVKKQSTEVDVDSVMSLGTLRSRFTRASSEELAIAMRELMEEDETGRRILSAVDIPVSATEETVSDETASRIFGGDIKLSQSRLESYVMCRFGFYCKYVLSLIESKRAALTYSDIGTFVHAVLERVFCDGSYKLADDELKAAVDRVIADYISDVIPSEQQGNARLMSLFRRLRRGVLEFMTAFRDEFEQSLFKPVLFELPIGLGGAETSLPSMKIPLGDGTFAVLRGIADRVDSYRDGEGTLYVRVVDYKTGKKTFSRSDIEEGKNLQLPLYMYTVVDNADGEMLKKLGGEPGDTIKPAGFLYVGVRPSDRNGSDGGEAAERKLARSGLLLNDEAVLRAMDRKLDGEYIPVKIKKDGSYHAGAEKSMADAESFTELYRELCGTVTRISRDMRSGNASVTSEKHGDDSPCDYCKMSAVCRASAKKKK